ncbi:MAG: hypothetical protein JSV58_04200 [Candidatus Bathyarchaeota archaeon]|nr:MAG: hypothetical protein JSV58_04200 [Candidatus Bathyarchaeota archaeon]
MPQVYLCRTCGERYTYREYEKSPFCRTCETYLISERKLSELAAGLPRTPKARAKRRVSTGNWLPDSYELRKGQMEFVSSASASIKANGILLASAPCGHWKITRFAVSSFATARRK